MPKENEETIRVHLHLYRSDKEFIDRHYSGKIGISKVVREVVHQKINQIKAKANEQSAPVRDESIEQLVATSGNTSDGTELTVISDSSDKSVSRGKF